MYQTDPKQEQGVSIDQLQSITTEDYKQLHPESFPFWVFPKEVQRIIIDGKESLAYPIDFFSASIFFACGLANGLTTTLEVKKGWTESSVMFMALVGKPGTNKSHPLKFAMTPIEEHDNETYSEYLQKLNDWEKSTDERGPKPQWMKVLLMDATLEAISEKHSFNKRGLGVYSEEIKSWLGNMGRYNSGSDIEQWLSIWSGSKIVIDRKGSKSVNITRSFVSVIGTIQPNILFEVLNGRNSENGFSDRVLLVMPDNLKKEYWPDNEISERSKENYSKIIKSILNKKLEVDNNGKVVPKVVPYTPSAWEIAKEWNQKNTDRCNSLSDKDSRLQMIYGKMDIYVSRFALTLQIMFDACEQVETNKVEDRSIKGAIEIVEYFVNCAKKVLSEFERKMYIDGNRKRKELFSRLPEQFTTSIAVKCGQEIGISERTVKDVLAKGILFSKTGHGEYEKK